MTEMNENVYEDEKIVADMVERYTGAETDEGRKEVVTELAEELGKSEASIRAKLVREGVYIAKKATAKNGEPIVKKSELVDKLVKSLGVELSENEASSLEKATKTALTKLVKAAEANAEAE